MRSRLFLIIGLWLIQAIGPASAVDLSRQTQTFFLNGFGTLGGVYNFSDQATFVRDKGQPNGPRDEGFFWETDSRIGIQGRWKPREDFEALLQIVSKYRYDGSYRPTVTWGFLKYAFTPDLELRVGRLGFDIFLNADSSDVGYSYLWVRPPVEYYLPIYYSHFDGLDLTAARPIGEGMLKAKLFGGRTDETIASSQEDLYQLNGEMWGGVLEYQLPKWLFRIGFNISSLYEDYESTDPLLSALRRTGRPQAIALADDLRLSQGDYVFIAGGVAYEGGPWRAQIGFSHIDTDNLIFPGSLATTLSLGYRVNRWTPYVTYSRVESEHPEAHSGLPNRFPYSLVDIYVNQAIKFNQFDQDTFSLGARYDFAKNAALKMQLDWTHNRDNPSIFWLDQDADWNGRTTLFSLSLDFVF